MVFNINYNFPTIRALSSLSWAEIKSIISAGNGPNTFLLGDSKDGATLIDISTTEATFSLGNVGSACIQRDSPYSYDHLKNTWLDVKDTGWYQSTSFAAGKGVTLSSVKSSLPQDMKSAMKTVTKQYAKASGTTVSLTSGTFTLYPPNYSEWINHKTYLPQSGVFWLRDAKRFIKDYQGSSTYYKEASWFQTYNVSQKYHGDAGYGWTGSSGSIKQGITNENLVLFFEV